MKRITGHLACVTFLLALVPSLSGCGSSRLSLGEQDTVRLEACDAGKVHVVWSQAYEEEGGFVVTGVVRRSDTVGQPVKVTVRARIVSPAGEVLDQAESEAINVPRRMVTKVQGFERFRLCFGSVPPAGSSTQMTPHSS